MWTFSVTTYLHLVLIEAPRPHLSSKVSRSLSRTCKHNFFNPLPTQFFRCTECTLHSLMSIQYSLIFYCILDSVKLILHIPWKGNTMLLYTAHWKVNKKSENSPLHGIFCALQTEKTREFTQHNSTYILWQLLWLHIMTKCPPLQ